MKTQPPVARSNHRFRIDVAGRVAVVLAVCLLFASYAGGSGAAPRQDTYTEVSGSPNPSNPGDEVTIYGRQCARVGFPPSGTIVFTDLTTQKELGEGSFSGATEASCSETQITVSSLSSGDHTIQAKYEPGGAFPGPETPPATYTQTVKAPPPPQPDDTFTMAEGTPNPSAAGKAVTIVGRQCNRTRNVQATGTIVFSDLTADADGTVELGRGELGPSQFTNCGETTITVSSLSVGDHRIGALYQPGGSVPVYPSARASYTQTVTEAATAQRQLSVSKLGSGSGTVTSAPAGINCGGICSASFASGTSVTLSAVAGPGSRFDGWGGACSGSSSCTLTMNGDKSVTATFSVTSAQQGKLTVAKQGTAPGSGTVLSDPAGIDCGAVCSAPFAAGTKVTLRHEEAAKTRFVGWDGACSGKGECVVTVSRDVSVTATFDADFIPPNDTPPEIVRGPEPPDDLQPDRANPADTKIVAQLAAGVTGNGVIEQEVKRGTLAVQPAGIRCGFNQFRCYTRLEPNQEVVLRAHPLRNYVFKAWTGACAGQGPKCTVRARALQTVTAIFAPRKASPTVGFAVSQIHVRVMWSRSVGSGTIVVSGNVGGPATLRVQVRRPSGGPLLTRRLSFEGGRFRSVIPFRKDVLPRGASILPGGFVVTVIGSSGASSLPFQLRPMVVPAPPEGVVRQAFVTTIEQGPATVRVPLETKQVWAHFLLATQPASRLPIKVVWYWPDGRYLGSVAKHNRPEIVSSLSLDSGLPRGAWIAELRAGNRLVKRLTVQIG